MDSRYAATGNKKFSVATATFFEGLNSALQGVPSGRIVRDDCEVLQVSDAGVSFLACKPPSVPGFLQAT
jgi:hypothetical protein